MSTLATVANMRAYERAHPGRTIDTPDGPAFCATAVCVAFSPTTGEQYSASSGDYWNMPEDEPLRDHAGEPMVLALSRCVMVDAMSGDVLA